ncbi:hypothetical protein MTO96_006892 [Rhipicephalus appendiculatus]
MAEKLIAEKAASLLGQTNDFRAAHGRATDPAECIELLRGDLGDGRQQVPAVRVATACNRDSAGVRVAGIDRGHQTATGSPRLERRPGTPAGGFKRWCRGSIVLCTPASSALEERKESGGRLTSPAEQFSLIAPRNEPKKSAAGAATGQGFRGTRPLASERKSKLGLLGTRVPAAAKGRESRLAAMAHTLPRRGTLQAADCSRRLCIGDRTPSLSARPVLAIGVSSRLNRSGGRIREPTGLSFS